MTDHRLTVVAIERERAEPNRQGDACAVHERERSLLMAKRQAIIIELGAIEDYLGLDRSIVPRRKRTDDRVSNVIR